MTFAPVGIKCPDHAGVGAPRRSPSPPRTVRQAQRTFGGLQAPATMALIAVNVLVYLVTVYQGFGVNAPGGALFDWGQLVGRGVANGDWWRLASAMFLHGSLLHLAFNMFALWIVGTAIESALGAPRYFLVYVVSGLAGSAGALVLPVIHTSQGFVMDYQPDRATVGASGAIYGLFGALLVLEYVATGTLAGQAMALIMVNLALSFAIPGISIGGHIGGLVGGTAATYALVRTRTARVAALGPTLVALVGAASIFLAYLRVESYV
jgi:membrane associated rhomboid family serine protease